MIKIIYPHIPSKWGQELKYSIRSVEKHFTDPHKIVIIGTKPPYLNNKLHHITEPEHNNTRHLFVMEYLCSILPDSEDIVFMDDDIYLLQDINTQKLKTRWYLQDLADIKTRGGKEWHQHLFSTGDHLSSNGYPQINYECHIPYHFNIGQMRKTFEFFEGVNKWLLNTGYNNLLNHDNILRVQDVKAGLYSKIKKMPQITNKTLFLNHDDNGLTDDMKAFLESTFPDKSQYEV